MSALVRRAEEAAERILRAESRGLNAVLAFDREVLLGQARTVAGREAELPLAGMTVAVKDNIATVEYPTTCASRILEGYRSPYQATAVRKLKEAGALIACKTNLDEFAMGSSTEHSAFGRTLHPLDPERVPGGSSGGSAALVAAGAVDAALGSETGGSVRQPAAFCGVVGIKPTYGRVSRYGLVAFGSSLDQIGVLARDVNTAARVLSVISGPDERDFTSAPIDPVRVPPACEHLSGIKVGIPEEYLPPDLDPAIRRGVERARRLLEEARAVVKEISLPHTPLAVPAYYIIAPAEASSNLARYDGVRYGRRIEGDKLDVGELFRRTRGRGFGAEVRRRIIVGTYVLSAGYYEAYYRRAVAARSAIARDFANAFDPSRGGVDLILAPTTPTTAFKAGEKLDDPVSMYLADVFVCPANLANVPAISLPIGRDQGLPVGIQLIGPQFSEERLLQAASVLERLADPEEELR
ncbi:Glutamyl-tRNA(Gln) amidotransferase subunit A [bacterium HR33]|nr:Glutamyl-tRNA(Gln) amidotransferase subunit A [bacterium HR33]